MKPSFNWYNGDSKNPPGIYTCLSTGFNVHVPLPNVIDSTKKYDRSKTIRCKNVSSDECLLVRTELAERFNSSVRSCNFAHSGDSIIKIGTSFRCPNNIRFGNYDYLSNDLSNATEFDIKTILSYSLSDSLLSAIWFQHNDHIQSTFINIDVC